MKNWRMWLHGLVSAVIGGAANSIVAMYVAPETFNLQEMSKLSQLAFGSGVISAALYLKESPLPKLKSRTVRTVTTTVEKTETAKLEPDSTKSDVTETKKD